MVTGSLLQEEYLRAQKFHRTACVKKIYLVLGAMAALGIVIKLFSDQDLLGLILICGGIGGALGELINATLILPRRLKKLYQQHAGFRSIFNYSWDNEALSVESDIGHARRPWSHFINFKESNEFFFLYHSDVSFELLPKRWFVSSDQVEEFRRISSGIGT